MTLEIIPDSAARVQATRATRAAIRRSYTRYTEGREPQLLTEWQIRAALAASDIPTPTLIHNVPERHTVKCPTGCGAWLYPGYTHVCPAVWRG